MTKKEFEDLLLKFEQQQCSTEEKNVLFQFYNDCQKNNRIASWEFSEKEAARIRILKRLNATIENNQTTQKKIINWQKLSSVAAVFIGFVFTMLFFTNNKVSKSLENNITLQLQDGTVKVLNGQTSNIKVLNANGQVIGKQKGNQLVYNKTDSDTLIYNTINVPYGKTFGIQLSDGTKVKLNSGSSLKYPVNFVKGKDRLVFITGEAYLDVVKDTMKPFVVNTNTINVKVFGTKFNVHAYTEDDITEVVLVSGSVGLYKKEDNKDITYLKPGFKASYKSESGEIYKTQVLTKIYTSWIDGELVFRDMDFDNILKKLERFYNIKIINNNTKLAKQKFQASFGRYPDIEQVFKELKMIYKIDYNINGESIIIN
ncbi:FecR family protein [Polaribacter sargassicola]|uniref:FecR family protein n=1 Tax=Polaribacter sargassicola TaxID=2836891 RepID=UPI001F4825B8|nr:FecR family protein [Polaribacter sp. DS7-9]MCG1035413.1 DUF4974 domain-containing protein [Polaribacter sp. DS7-9]